MQIRAASSTDLRRPRVLVVDDDADIREALALVLVDEGYEVEAVAGGREALARLAQHPPPDLIVLDLMMPNVSGWDVLAALRASPAPRIPVVVISAGRGIDADDLSGARLLGKPVALDVFLRAIEESLAEAG